MRQTAQTLQAFYQARLGRLAAQAANARLRAAWDTLGGLDVLGLGYPQPFLEPFAKAARRCILAMPQEQGAIPWDLGQGNVVLLSEQARLPLRDNLFDRVLIAHGLEESDSPHRLLREVWRVMAPEGRLIVLVANRAGLWARNEAQPFGHGRPYSRGQLADLLRGAALEPLASARVLFAPPVDWPLMLALAPRLEELGSALALPLGGLLLMEAIKRQHISPDPGLRSPAREMGLKPA